MLASRSRERGQRVVAYLGTERAAIRQIEVSHATAVASLGMGSRRSLSWDGETCSRSRYAGVGSAGLRPLPVAEFVAGGR